MDRVYVNFRQRLSSRQLGGHRRPATQVRRKPIRAVLKTLRALVDPYGTKGR